MIIAYFLWVVRDHLISIDNSIGTNHAALITSKGLARPNPTSSHWFKIIRSCICGPTVFDCICKIRHAHHKLRSSNSSVSPLLSKWFIIFLKVVVKMSLQSHIPDESLSTDTALKFDALIDLWNSKDIKPILVWCIKM